MQPSNETIMVIGHKNPDTDSICSAIAYAALKNQQDSGQYIPRRAGDVSNETLFVLNHFNVPVPELLTDASSQVTDIEINRVPSVSGGISLRQAYTTMKAQEAVTLAITNQDGYLEGIITIGDIATSGMDVYDNRIVSKARTPYQNIIETLDGTLVTGDPEAVFEQGKIIVAAATPDIMEEFIDPGDMVILSNRFDSQYLAIEMKASCLVVCTGAELHPTIIRKAQENRCAIITTAYDTYTATRMINQSMPCKFYMTDKNLLTFHLDDFTHEVREVMSKQRHRYFPVLDENDKYYGLISKRSLLDLRRKKVILVDHNEKNQAVDGLAATEILEIIDHHRLGNLETLTPVFFRNQPVGCTATIIYQMYLEQGAAISPEIAGLLCAAIISDTLMYRSPTCTPLDKQAAEALADIAGIAVEPFAIEMFGAGSDLKDKSTEEIFYQDFKTFNTAGVSFGVGQITSMNGEELSRLKASIHQFMDSLLKQSNHEMLFFMLTNIITESSELVFAGASAKAIVESAFQCSAKDDLSADLPGVVSRKKQLLPNIINAIQQ